MYQATKDSDSMKGGNKWGVPYCSSHLLPWESLWAVVQSWGARVELVDSLSWGERTERPGEPQLEFMGWRIGEHCPDSEIQRPTEDSLQVFGRVLISPCRRGNNLKLGKGCLENQQGRGRQMTESTNLPWLVWAEPSPDNSRVHFEETWSILQDVLNSFKSIQIIRSMFSDHNGTKLKIKTRRISGKFLKDLKTKYPTS